MANKRSCRNNLIIDMAKGILVPESQAYAEQLSQSINTGTSAYETANQLTPVPTCADGKCAASECPNGKEIAYLNYIKTIATDRLGAPIFQLTIVSAEFIDNESDSPVTPLYNINWGDGSPDTGATIGIPEDHDISSLPDSLYHGIVEETTGGAYMEFWYQVIGGVLVGFASRSTSVELKLTCELYPNYTVTVIDTVTLVEAGTRDIENETITILGEEVLNEDYIPAVHSNSETGILTSDLNTVDETISAIYTLDGGGGPIENRGILRTQCIE